MYFPPYKLIWLAIKATWALSYAAYATPADIIHIGKPHPMNSIAGILLKFSKRKCIFLDMDDYEAESNLFKSKWQRHGVKFFEDNTPRWVDHITTNNSFLRNRLISLGILSHKISYVPNGIDIDRFAAPDPDELEILRTKLNLHNSAIIAFIGTLSLPSHPIYLLLDAFIQVKNELPNCALLIVCGGEEFNPFRKKVEDLNLSDSVIFTGWIPREKISLYYALSDVVVAPYTAGTQSAVAALALAYRKPLILTDHIAAALPNSHREFATVIPANDISSLSNAIIASIKEPHFEGKVIPDSYYSGWDQIVHYIEQVARR